MAVGDTGALAACVSALALPLLFCCCPFCTLPARPVADGLADAPLGVPLGVLGVPRGVVAADVPAACTAAVILRTWISPSSTPPFYSIQNASHMQSCMTPGRHQSHLT